MIGHYLPTEKNGMVRDLFPRMGFTLVEETPERTTWRLETRNLHPAADTYPDRPESYMTQTEILAKMQTVFDDVFLDDVKVTPELSANDVEEWDSLLQISLVLGVEKAFGVRFRVGEVEATKNLGEFADLIQRRMAETAKA